MTWWPQSLAWRVTLALAVAGGGVAVLAVSVAEADANHEPPPHRAPPPAGPTGLGFVLAPVRGSVLLAAGFSAIAPQTAPVIQVLADGSLALRRPAPLASVPGGATAGTGDAAIVLPGRSLRGLDPAVRAALLDIIGQLVDVRPVPPGRIRAVDVECAPKDLERLLRWVR
jgi:hypothetical protein